MKFYLTALFWIISVNGLLVFFFKKKFGYTCALSFILGALFLYLFGFKDNIRLGYYVTWIEVAIFWVLVLINIIKGNKEKIKEFISNYFSIGFFVFIILCIYSFVLNYKQGFGHCDEFTHWGPMVISMLKSNAFYAKPESVLTFHRDYPPLFSILQILWCGFDGFNFSETYCFIALSVFMFSCFLPVLETLSIKSKKDWIKAIVILLSIVIVGITISKTFTAQEYAFVYNSIYIDWPLAIFTTYCLFTIYKETEWNSYIYIFLTISLSSLLLMKQMGIFFYLFVLLFAFVKVLFIDKKLNLKRLIKGIICFAVVPLIAYLSWKHIVDLYEIQGQFVVGNLDYKNILHIVSGNIEDYWRHEALFSFLGEIINRPLVLHPFQMSFVVYVLFVSVLLVVLLKNKKEKIFIPITFVLGAIGYVTVMALLYSLGFDKYEAARLASFDRYMSTFLYIGTTLVLLIAYDIVLKYKPKIINTVVIFVILCLFVEPDSINNLIPRLKVTDTTERIFVIRQYGDFKPNREDLNGLRFEFNDLGFVDETTMPTDKWISLFKEYPLFYVVHYDDYIHNDLWLPLEPNVYLWDDNIYTIHEENGKFTFECLLEQYYDYVMRYYLMDKTVNAVNEE